MSEEVAPRVTPREWIRVGNVDAVVCFERELGRAEVVYTDDRQRAINEDVTWAAGRWHFEHPGPHGGYADRYPRLAEFVALLRQGPLPQE